MERQTWRSFSRIERVEDLQAAVVGIPNPVV